MQGQAAAAVSEAELLLPLLSLGHDNLAAQRQPCVVCRAVLGTRYGMCGHTLLTGLNMKRVNIATYPSRHCTRLLVPLEKGHVGVSEI